MLSFYHVKESRQPSDLKKNDSLYEIEKKKRE